MSDFNDLLPEERDEQNQRLIASLRRSFDPSSEDKQSLTRIRERLLQLNMDSLPHATSTSIMPQSPQSHRKGKTDMQFIRSRFYEGKTWQQRLGTLVAVIFVLILVGSLATVFYVRSHHSDVGSQQTLSPGWKQVASLSGTGSKTLTHLNIQLTQFWGYSVGCTGNANFTLELVEIKSNIVSGCTSTTHLASQIEPQSFQFGKSSRLVLNTIKITAPSNLIWYLRITNSDASTMPFLSTLTATQYGWASYTGLGGDGDGEIASFVGSVQTLGLLMRCDRNGTLQIKFNSLNSSAKTFACDTNTNLHIIHFPQSMTLQSIKVHASSIGSWYLETVLCTNEKTCSRL